MGKKRSVKGSKYLEKRTIRLPENSLITINSVLELQNLFEFDSPQAYRDTLQELFYSYVRHEHDSLPLDFKRMVDQVQLLDDFLKRTDAKEHA